MNFVYDSGGIGKGGTAAISVDGREVATGRIKKTVPVRISQEEGLRPEMIGRARPQRIARLASRSVGRSEGGLVGAQPTIGAGRVRMSHLGESHGTDDRGRTDLPFTTTMGRCDMKLESKFLQSRRQSRARLGRAIAAALVLALAAPVSADDAMDAKQLVEKAKLTIDSFAADKVMGAPVKNLLKKAKGAFISPQVLRGAFIVGVSGGSGVLVVRDAKTDAWHGPAFYTMGEASFGLQAGGDASEVVLLLMTDRGVNAMLSTSVKLGADASVAAGPVGGGAQASTANISADILTFTRSKGLYGGVSLEGAVVATRDGLNEAFYGKKDLKPADILVQRTVTNPAANPLLADVRKLAASK
jgi:lipid-binding SYLF domain-containing protein